MDKLLHILKINNIKQFNIDHIMSSVPWVDSLHSWKTEGEKFKSEVARLDKIRGENFTKVFPELASLLDTPLWIDDKKRPVFGI